MTPIEFLNRLRPGGPWCLTAIPPEGGATETRTFKNADDAEAWIAQHNGKRNLYYTVGTVAQPTSKKPTKADIATLEYLWVDVDPFAGEDLQAERARILAMLREAKPEPSVIVDSGGGFQALWKLSEPLTITDPAEAERYNRELERIFKADSCHNVDRLLRLPGSLNIPNAKKRAKGREAAEAEVYCWNDTSYPLSAFTAAPPMNSAASTKPRAATGKASAHVSMGDGTAVGVDELRAWAETNRATIQDHTLALVARRPQRRCLPDPGESSDREAGALEAASRRCPGRCRQFRASWQGLGTAERRARFRPGAGSLRAVSGLRSLLRFLQ